MCDEGSINTEKCEVLVSILRQEFPTDTVKRCARAFDAAPRTVIGWLYNEQFPNNRHFDRMAAYFPPGFVEAVYEPCYRAGKHNLTSAQYLDRAIFYLNLAKTDKNEAPVETETHKTRGLVAEPLV